MPSTARISEERIKELVSTLDSKSSLDREAAWLELKPLGIEAVPHLARAYPQFRRKEGRLECVFHSIRFARVSENAFQLGLTALNDRATLVRYRACGLLAYSLRLDAIPKLSALISHEDTLTAADARAAIDAIEHQNHHYFVDRNHSGSTFWDVNPGNIPPNFSSPRSQVAPENAPVGAASLPSSWPHPLHVFLSKFPYFSKKNIP